MFNPLSSVGSVVNVPGLNDLIAKMGKAWADFKAQGKVNSTLAVQFLETCLDSLIVYMVEHDIPGEDKKATVLNAVGKLYDIVMNGLLPIYLRPFSGVIKTYIINIVISSMIDWIVTKYNSGSWHPQATTQMLSMWDDHKIN